MDTPKSRKRSTGVSSHNFPHPKPPTPYAPRKSHPEASLCLWRELQPWLATQISPPPSIGAILEDMRAMGRPCQPLQYLTAAEKLQGMWDLLRLRGAVGPGQPLPGWATQSLRLRRRVVDCWELRICLTVPGVSIWQREHGCGFFA